MTQTLWSYTKTEGREKAAVVYHSPGRKPASHLIALADWETPGPGTFVVIRSLGTASETWRRFETSEQMNAWIDKHGLVPVCRKDGPPMRSVAEWRADLKESTP